MPYRDSWNDRRRAYQSPSGSYEHSRNQPRQAFYRNPREEDYFNVRSRRIHDTDRDYNEEPHYRNRFDDARADYLKAHAHDYRFSHYDEPRKYNTDKGYSKGYGHRHYDEDQHIFSRGERPQDDRNFLDRASDWVRSGWNRMTGESDEHKFDRELHQAYAVRDTMGQYPFDDNDEMSHRQEAFGVPHGGGGFRSNYEGQYDPDDSTVESRRHSRTHHWEHDDRDRNWDEETNPRYRSHTNYGSNLDASRSRGLSYYGRSGSYGSFRDTPEFERERAEARRHLAGRPFRTEDHYDEEPEYSGPESEYDDFTTQGKGTGNWGRHSSSEFHW